MKKLFLLSFYIIEQFALVWIDLVIKKDFILLIINFYSGLVSFLGYLIKVLLIDFEF